MSELMAERPSPEELNRFILRVFPTRDGQPRSTVETIDERQVRMRLRFSERQLRPGGTIAGPVLMSLADQAFYMLVLHNLGFDAVGAVTCNLNMNFLRRPEPADLLAEGRLLKLGRRLAVGDVSLTSDGHSGLVAHATVTYTLP